MVTTGGSCIFLSFRKTSL